MDRNTPTLIIEPMVLFREGLRRILWEAQFQVFWCSDTAPSTPIVALPGSARPLVIIGTEIDEAITHITQVRLLYPRSRIVMLVEPSMGRQVLAALSAGADTLLLRESSHETFIGTLKLVMNGVTVLPSTMVTLLLSGAHDRTAIAELPPQPLDCVPETPGEPSLADELSLDEDPQASTARAPDDIALSEELRPDELPAAVLAQQEFGLSLREVGVLERLREGRSNKEIARDLGITEATVKVHVKAILRKARMRNRTQVAMWASRLGVGTQHSTSH